MTICNKKYTLPLFFLIAANLSIILTGCGGGGGGGIFKAISEEEKLNKSSTPLFIRGLTYCGGNLYVTNGSKIFSKGVNQKRGWSEVGGYGNNIATIASNGTDLYVMTWNTASDAKGTTNPIVRHGGGTVTGISGEIYNIFDNKVYGGAGQECFAYTSTGTYQLTGTTATLVGNFKSACGSQRSDKDYCAGGQAYNHDDKIEGINGDITGMAVYKGQVIIASQSVGYYKKNSSDKWQAPPFSEEKNSGQFATQGTHPGGLWVVGNTIYLSLDSHGDKRDGLWAYYDENDSWNME